MPFWREVARGDDDAVGFIAAAQGVAMLTRARPRFAEVVGAHFAEREEHVAAGEEQLLHGEDDARRGAGNDPGAGMDPARFAVVAAVDTIELDFETHGGGG